MIKHSSVTIISRNKKIPILNPAVFKCVTTHSPPSSLLCMRETETEIRWTPLIFVTARFFIQNHQKAMKQK